MTQSIPADLLAAFEAYERAILADDLDYLDATFAPGEATMRGDSAGLLVGHEAISAFRGVRGGVPPRSIERIEYRPLGTDVALLVSISRYRGGGTGLQTQVWQRIEAQWLITAAHVSPRAQALDRSVWRSVGDPLWQGAWEGPLAGLTVAVKDVFAIKGYRIGAGNPTYLAGSRPEKAMAPAVSDLLRAGVSIRGIARTDEFAYSIAGDNPHYGSPPNGALPGAMPGGSSSGPASAVATGQAEIGLATDTAGSVRVPASYQGLWGLRTTHGLVPRQGMLPLAQSFDTVGWITRDGSLLERVVECCLHQEIAGADPPDVSMPDRGDGLPEQSHADQSHADQSDTGRYGPATTEAYFASRATTLPWRLIVPEEVLAAAEAPAREAFDAFLRGLTAAEDPPIIEVASIGDLAGFVEPFRTVQGAEAWRNNGDWVEQHPGAVGPATAARFAFAATVTPDQEAAAREHLTRQADLLTVLVRDAVLIFPTVPGPAPMRIVQDARIDQVRQATLAMTTPAAIAGLPALTVPLLTVPSNLGPAPVGVCLVSAAGTDLDLVLLGRRIAARCAGVGDERTESP